MIPTVIYTDLANRSFREEVRLFFIFVTSALLIISVMIGFFQRTVVVGHSMDATLHHGQNLLLARTDWNPLLAPRHGDIVVAKYEDGLIIKRVIACPGDTIEIYDNQVYLNGTAQQEPYLNEPMLTANITQISLDDGQYFLMGDNRNCSLDSRRLGSFSEEAIYGVIYLEWQPLLWSIYFGSALVVIFMLVSLFSENKKERDPNHEQAL